MGFEPNAVWLALTRPFTSEVRRRSVGGREFSYITARAVMNRLDDVVGPENWWEEYIPGEHSVICRLSIRVDEGVVITKQDAGGYAGMSDQGDDDKSGFSDAFKRAAVKFGIGRHLYGEGVPCWAVTEGDAPAPRPAPQQQAARPSQQQEQAPAPKKDSNGQRVLFDWVPKIDPSGVKLPFFAWTRNLEEHFSVTLVNRLKEVAKELGYSTTFRDWDQHQTNVMSERMIAGLKKLPQYAGEFDNIKYPSAVDPNSVQHSDGSDEDIPF